MMHWAQHSHLSAAGDFSPHPSYLHAAPPPVTQVYYFNPGNEIYSRKVFVGGLPIDIIENDLFATFSRFGNVVVDWPHKNQIGGYVPPKGYVFLVFEQESSVQALVSNCYSENDKFYMCISSPMMKDKPVQIRPWRLADADFVVDSAMELHTRRTVFLGGVPRPLKAVTLAELMDRLFGNVCYAGIDTDPELKYPKGAGRVAFASNESYIAAIAAKYVHLQHGDVDKRVEVKPYVLDEQACDECGGRRCDGKYAPHFCAAVSCLQHYCQSCWDHMHVKGERATHKPFLKENMKERGPGRHAVPFHRLTLPPHCNSAAIAANQFTHHMTQAGNGHGHGHHNPTFQLQSYSIPPPRH